MHNTHSINLKQPLKSGGLLLTLLLALTVWLVWPALPAHAQEPDVSITAFPGINGKIVFASDRDGNYEIYVMDADGGNQTRLTNNTAKDDLPTWSPDGTKILFVRDRLNFYTMNADGSGETLIHTIEDGIGGAKWSPDGTKIVFTGFDSANFSRLYDIYTINLDGSGLTALTSTADIDSLPAWSPDGSKIAFQRGTNIFVMNADGSGATALTSSGRNTDPAWSPDGSKIAYASDQNAGGGQLVGDIWVMDADGTNKTQLMSTSTTIDSAPAWSPDGSQITFYTDRDFNDEIYVMKADGSAQTRLTTNSAADNLPDWQPLGIAVTTTTDELNTNGKCSLREAITNANDNAATYPDCHAGSGHDIIAVPAGTYLLTLTGADENLNATGDLDSIDPAGLTLIGADPATTIIDGNGTDRILDQRTDGALALQGLTIQHGNLTTGGGGGILHEGTSGTLTLTNTYVLSNTVSKSGGGVSSNSTLLATNSRFIGNTAGEGGGGVNVVVPGAVTLNGGLFQGNVAATAGGGLNVGGTLTVTDTRFISNTAAFGGGVIIRQVATLTGAAFRGNQASTQGGGLLAQLDLTLSGTEFLNNSAPIGSGTAAYRSVTVSQVVTSTDNLFVRGNWQHNGTLNQQGGAVKMGGTSAQTIAGTQPVNIANLEIANTSSAGVTLGSNITVTTHLTLTHDLYTTPAYRVNLTGGATTAGTGDVWGNSYREHAFAGSYAYGNPNVSIKFDNVGTLPNAILVELSKSQPTAFASAVTRAYTVTTTGGSGYAATLRLHYKDTELNGNSEPGLALFRYNGSAWDKQGRSANDTSANWLEQSSVSDLSAPWAIGSALDCTDSGWQVSDEVDLNAAIGCFNGQTVAGSYTITVTQNISLTAGTQAIANTTGGVSLVIEGSNNTVDGQGTTGVRPFEVAASTTVTMNDLTVTGGNVANEGGGILNRGTLTLDNVALNGNSADNHGGGIENTGSLTLTDSDINGNNAARGGGGLHNQGFLTVSGVTFRNNTAGSGTLGTGGAFQANAGTADFTNSTFSANQATGTTDDGGGAIMVYGGTVTLHNVTIAGNSSATKGGGISVYNGIATQDAAGGTLTMDNTLVGDNSASGSGPDVSGPITSNDYNLIENTVGATFMAQAHDITEKDPRLGLLANNGGNTLTHGLLTGSPAIDTGNTGLTVDQRGATRPTGLADDIGAFEATAQEGTIIIRTSIAPPDANLAGFVFDTSISGHENFTLKGIDKKSILNVASGTYTVTEQTNATYELSGLICTDSNTSGTASTGDIASHTATIHLDPGEIVSCSFVNAVNDSLTIEKITIPDSPDTIFNYLSNGTGNLPSSFSVKVGETTVFTNVLPETYDLIETAQAGYNLTSLSCTNADGDIATGDLNTGSVSVVMETGEQWHCTSVSTQRDLYYFPIITKNSN